MGNAYALDWNVIIKIAKEINVKTDLIFFILLREYENTLIEVMKG